MNIYVASWCSALILQPTPLHIASASELVSATRITSNGHPKERATTCATFVWIPALGWAWLPPKTKCLGWSDGSSNSVVESQLWCERNILEDVPKIGQKSKWNSLTPNWSSSDKLHLYRLCKVCCLFLKKTPTPQTALCAPYPCPISHPPWCTVTDPSEPQKQQKSATSQQASTVLTHGYHLQNRCRQ